MSDAFITLTLFDTSQAIGLLIGMEDVPLERQSEYLSALLTPLCQQVKFDYLLNLCSTWTVVWGLIFIICLSFIFASVVVEESTWGGWGVLISFLILQFCTFIFDIYNLKRSWEEFLIVYILFLDTRHAIITLHFHIALFLFSDNGHFKQVETLLLNANWEESPLKISNIQQIVMAINALSKVFI